MTYNTALASGVQHMIQYFCRIYTIMSYYKIKGVFPLLHNISLLFIYLIHSSLYPGEDNGTPLQYSCLENPMDGGAWWAAVYGVAQSRTRLKQLSSSSSSSSLYPLTPYPSFVPPFFPLPFGYHKFCFICLRVCSAYTFICFVLFF